MHAQLRQRALDLRVRKNLSYSEIRKRLGVPKGTLSYWLHDFPLSEEKILELRRRGWTKGEASRERFRATMRKKKERQAQEIYSKYTEKFSKLSQDALFISGLMLYLGEGDKKNSTRICIANTDLWIIKFFIQWMERFLGIPHDRVRVQLHLYENMNIEKEKNFWKKGLRLKDGQFYKVMIRKLKAGSFSYAESYRHGTCSVYALGVEKKTELMMATRAFLDACA